MRRIDETNFRVVGHRDDALEFRPVAVTVRRHVTDAEAAIS